MSAIPRTALLLGLAGLLPFFAGAWLANGATPSVPENTYPLIVPTDGTKLVISYGSIILSFMSGCLWGFATRAKASDQIWAYGLSVLPALYVFFAISGAAADQITGLIIGFIAILAFDALYQRKGLAPPWWLRLRLMITVFVTLSLAVTLHST